MPKMKRQEIRYRFIPSAVGNYIDRIKDSAFCFFGPRRLFRFGLLPIAGKRMDPSPRYTVPGADILYKQVDIEIGFTRHLLADRNQDLQEPRPSVHSLTMHQKLWGDYCGRKKARGCIEDTDSCLFSDIRDMPEVPGDEVIDLVE